MEQNEIIRSSGNVFEDLGFDREESALLRAKSLLMMALSQYIRQQKWTQAQAAEHFGCHQPYVSDLVNGKLHRFSLDQLVRMAEHAGLRLNIGLEHA